MRMFYLSDRSHPSPANSPSIYSAVQNAKAGVIEIMPSIPTLRSCRSTSHTPFGCDWMSTALQAAAVRLVSSARRSRIFAERARGARRPGCTAALIGSSPPRRAPDQHVHS